jgi:hypothetical protein
MVLALLRGQSVWRSGRRDRLTAREASGVSEIEGVSGTPDPSVQRSTTASQRASGHRNPDSLRSNGNTTDMEIVQSI